MITGISVEAVAIGPSKTKETASPARQLLTESWGIFVVLGFFLALVPLFRWAHIPFSITLSELAWRYVGVALASIGWASFLALIQFPRQLLLPLWLRYRHSPARTVILAVLISLLFALYPLSIAIVLSVVSVVILEVYERNVKLRMFSGVVLPGIYLFFGILTVFAYNVLAVTVRFTPNYDHVLAACDRVFLFGHTIQQVAHGFAGVVPKFVLGILQISYFELFSEIGAALILCAVLGRREYAMRFVSTILIAYVLSVAVFFAFPTHSPYYACPTHASSSLPPMIINGQLQLMERALSRSQGIPTPVQAEYFIAFPCMHVAQPLIILWFVRRWKRILGFFIAVDLVLFPAIVLLEWHYVTDLLGGVLVAVLAMVVSERLAANRIAQPVDQVAP